MSNVTELEIQNANKVMGLLCQIDGISFKQSETREDIFIVSEEDTELECLIDVEEDVVVCLIEVTPLTNGMPTGLAEKLLEINNTAVYGAFTSAQNHLYFKSNLAVENLDLNELEGSLTSLFYTVHSSLDVISSYFTLYH